jgi:ATP-binding cassette, subfamily B, bacterial PglK
VKSIRDIWSLLGADERRGAVLLAALMLLGMAMESIGIGLVMPAIGALMHVDVVREYPLLGLGLRGLGNPDPSRLAVMVMLALVAAYLIKALVLAFLAWRQMRFAYGVQADLSQRLFASYLRRPYRFHLQRNSAHLVQNVIGEVGLFTVDALLPALTLLAEVLVLFGLFCLLLAVEPAGTLIVVLVLLPTAWAINRSLRGPIARWGESRQFHETMRMQRLQEGLAGAKDVKVLGRENEFLERYRLHNAEGARAAQLQSTILQLPRLWLELVAVSAMALLVIVMLVQGREFQAIVPTAGLFAAAAFRLIPSANRILAALHSLRYGIPVIEVLRKELEDEADPAPNRAVDVQLRSTLQLVDVSYSYPGAKVPALREISFAVRRGECVGIIGPSGAGKSTLVDVMLGLLAPDAGTLLVDGKNLHENVRSWQDQIGYVPQSMFLTDDTLRRNVAFGLADDEIDECALLRAIRAAQLHEFVAALPAGLDTLVGERGIRLSGGQRQRIGIARALYHDPQILVLDEATSELDVETEREIMQGVEALHGSKTIIIVAHRTSTVDHCDRIYRLHAGRGMEEARPLLQVTR